MITAGVRTQVKYNHIIPNRPTLSCVHPSPDLMLEIRTILHISAVIFNEMKPVLLIPPLLEFALYPSETGPVHLYFSRAASTLSITPL